MWYRHQWKVELIVCSLERDYSYWLTVHSRKKMQTHPAIDKLKSIEIRRNTMFSGTLLQVIEEKKRREKEKGKKIFLDFRHNENAWFGFLGSEDFHHWLLFLKYRNFRVADSCFDDNFLFKKLQDQVQKPVTTHVQQLKM